MPKSERTAIDPQEAFTIALMMQFQKQRELLHIAPNADDLSKLDDQHPISIPAKSKLAQTEWLKLVQTTKPHTTQVRSMAQDDVLRLLELIRTQCLLRETEMQAITSAWIWSLLARVQDVGTMGNDSVSLIREFGKKAILVQLSFHEPDAAKQLEHAADEEDLGNRGSLSATNASVVFATKAEGATTDQDANSINSENDTASTQNTLATLDMIIAVVGEVFGQRDLLEFRQPWSESTVSHDHDT